MTNRPPPDNYLSYLVRLWRSDATTVWRATLQDPHTGEHFRFETIEGLFVFLRNRMGDSFPLEVPTSPLPSEQKQV